MTVTQAVCLVGGRGTRLGALTDSMPKPLLPVGGRPFLDYLVQEARRFGLERLLLLTGYQSDTIGKRYDGQKFGSLSVDVVVEASPAGTAGALANAARHLDETFFLLNGDSFFDFNWLRLATALPQSDWTIHATLAKGIAGTRYGRIDLEGDRIRGFRPEGGSSEPINAGIYLVRRKILGKIKTSPCSLEREILPELAERGELIGTAAEGAFIDIGIPDDFARAQQVMPTYMRRPVAFLDRDGVLNRRRWIRSPTGSDRVDRRRHRRRALAQRRGLLRIRHHKPGRRGPRILFRRGRSTSFTSGCSANCSGMARISMPSNICPHHPDGTIEQYRKASMLRKPAPGMITKLQAEWATDASGSFLIGDRDTDVQAAEAAGIPGHKFPGGNLLRVRQATRVGRDKELATPVDRKNGLDGFRRQGPESARPAILFGFCRSQYAGDHARNRREGQAKAQSSSGPPPCRVPPKQRQAVPAHRRSSCRVGHATSPDGDPPADRSCHAGSFPIENQSRAACAR